MASNQSISVTVLVEVEKAKSALANFSSAGQKVVAELKKVGEATKDVGLQAEKTGQKIVESSKIMDKNTQSTQGMWKEIVKGSAAYDVLKKGVSIAIDFLQGSISAAIEAQKTMQQVKTNVENAGFSFEQIAPKINAYSDSLKKLGFDDDDTAASLSKLLLVTKNYDQAVKLSNLSADLARSKNIALSDAVRLVTQVTQGNGRVLKEYGISLSDTASVADNLATMQDKVKNSAKDFASTLPGQLEVMKVKWDDIRKKIGIDLLPVVTRLVNELEKNLPNIEILLNGVTSAVIGIANAFSAVSKAWGGFGQFFADLGGARGRNVDQMIEEQNAQNALSKAIYDNQTVLKISTEQSKKNLEVTSAQAIVTKKLSVITADAGKTQLSVIEAVDQGVNKLSVDNKKAGDQIQQTNKTTAVTFEGVGGAASGALDSAKKAQDDFAAAVKKGMDDAKKSFDDLGGSITALDQKQGSFTFKAKSDLASFNTLINDIADNQEDWLKRSAQGFDALASHISAVNGDIDSLNGKLTELIKSQQDWLKSTKTSGSDSFAQIIFDAQKAIPELEKQLQAARDRMSKDISSGNNPDSSQKEVNDLQKQLDEKNAILESSRKDTYAKDEELSKQLAFLKEQDKRNELDQAYALMQQQIDIKTKQYESEKAQILQQIQQKTIERDEYIKAQTEMTESFKENVLLRQESIKKEIDNLQKLTDQIGKTAAAYKSLPKTVAGNTTTNSTLTGKAEGGPVDAGRSYLVGENGPEMFTSNQSGLIIPNNQLGGSTTININNPTVRNDSDIKEIIRQVNQSLSRRDELAQFGALK